MFGSFQWNRVSAVTLLSMIYSCLATAGEPAIQAHGFFSQGYNLSNGNNFFGESRNGGSFEFTEIGVNASARITPNLLASVQLVARAAGNTDKIRGVDDVDIDYALLDYRIDLSAWSYTGIRAGRVKNAIGLYNDTRDVLFTRPGVLMPQPIYFDAFGLRELLQSSDGAMGYGYARLGNHGLGLEFSVTDPRDSSPGAIAELTNHPGSPGKLDGDPVLIGRIQYEFADGRAKTALTHIDYRREYRPTSNDSTPPGNFNLTYTLLSAQLNEEHWGLTAEALLLDIDRKEFGDQTGVQKAAGWYLQANWRFASKWNAIARYDSYYFDRHDRNGRERSAASGGIIPQHLYFARDAVLGIQWEICDHWFFAADLHYIVGTAWISVLDNPNLYADIDPTASDVGGEKYWQLLSTMISYRF